MGETFLVPKRFKIKEDGKNFTATWSCFSIGHVFSLFFGIAFWIFFPFFTIGLLNRFFLFWPLRLFVSGFLLYDFICGVVNSTEVSLTPAGLSVRFFPLPSLSRNMVVPLSNISQVVVTRVGYRYKPTAAGTTTYWVNIRPVVGKEIQFLPGLPLKEAQYLSEALQERINFFK